MLQRKPIPLRERAPDIIVYALAYSFLADYVVGVPEYGVLGAFEHTHFGRLSIFVAVRAVASGRCAYRLSLRARAHAADVQARRSERLYALEMDGDGRG